MKNDTVIRNSIWLYLFGIKVCPPLTIQDEEMKVSFSAFKIMNNRERETEIEIGRGANIMILLKIVLLTNWWVSAAFRDFCLQVHLSACLSVSCFIVVLLSMLDFQLYPDSPNDNAAGKREVVDGRGVNKRSPNHRSPASSPFPSSPVSQSGQPGGDQTCL